MCVILSNLEYHSSFQMSMSVPQAHVLMEVSVLMESMDTHVNVMLDSLDPTVNKVGIHICIVDWVLYRVLNRKRKKRRL